MTVNTLTARVAGNIELDRGGLSARLRRILRDELTIIIRRSGRPEQRHSLFRESGDRIILPRGYVERLRQVTPLSVADKRLYMPRIDLRFRGELRPYQKQAVEEMKQHSHGVLVAPPGSGKTVMAMALIAHYRRPTLILCHTRDLATQLAGAAERFLNITPGFVGNGVFKPKPVTVAIVQSLNAERVNRLSRRFGMVLLDEAHHAPARTFTEVLGSFPAKFRYGVTATPERTDGLGPFIEHTIGPIRHRVTTEDLHAAGVLVKPTVVYVTTNFTYPYFDDYADMISALVANPDRNNLIMSHLLREADAGHRCLVLSERVQHAERLGTMFEEARPGQGAVATGSTGTEGRKAALNGLRTGELKAVFATRIADEGLDVPELERLFVVTPSRATSRVTQRLGRLMRTAPGKAAPVVYDFVDNRVGVLRSQALHRHRTVYTKLAVIEPKPLAT